MVCVIILLGLTSLAAAQPTLTALTGNNQGVACSDEAVSYRCEGTSPLLVWRFGSSQVIYDITDDVPGDGAIRDSAISTILIQITPSVVSVLTVFDKPTDPELIIRCLEGPSIGALVGPSELPYVLPENPSDALISILRALPAVEDVGEIEVSCNSSLNDSFEVNCRLQLFVDNVLSQSLDTLVSNPVGMRFIRPAGKDVVSIHVNGSIFTECNSSSRTSLPVMYSFPVRDADPFQGLRIAVIVLGIACGLLLITVLGLSIGLACANKPSPPNPVHEPSSPASEKPSFATTEMVTTT